MFTFEEWGETNIRAKGRKKKKKKKIKIGHAFRAKVSSLFGCISARKMKRNILITIWHHLPRFPPLQLYYTSSRSSKLKMRNVSKRLFFTPNFVAEKRIIISTKM